MSLTQIAALVPLAALWAVAIIGAARTQASPAYGVIEVLIQLGMQTALLGALALGVTRRWPLAFYLLLALYLLPLVVVPSLLRILARGPDPMPVDPFWGAWFRDMYIATATALALVSIAALAAVVMIVGRIRVGPWGIAHER